jgi:hypothetical protein
MIKTGSKNILGIGTGIPPMLNINPDKKKVILSLDGGGMRGMITIAMLAELEAMTGQTCQAMFDLVAGTSTGAIIAAGIGLGISAKDMLEQIYRLRLPNAFRIQPRGLGLWVRYCFNGLRNLYDIKPFYDALSDLAAARYVRDFTKPIVLMTTKDVRTSNTYYIVSKGPGAPMFADWPVAGAVAASGAAPIFFPPVLGNLVDGGVGVYGNPCLAASVEAMEYIGEDEGFMNRNVIHLSLGTGYTLNTAAEGKAAQFWLYNWINYIINESLLESALQQVLTTRAIYERRMDFRRYNPLLTAASVHDVLGVSLTGMPDPGALGLDSYEPKQVELMEAIGRAYAHKIDWTTKDYMPWVSDKNAPDFGQAHDGGHPLPRVLPVNWSQLA